MSISTSLITQAAIPGICLAAVGFAWLYFWEPIRALPAALFSLGVALLALMALVVLVYSTPLVHMLDDVIWVVLGVTLLIYIASLIGCVRLAQASNSGVVVFGLLGLIPLWFLGGFVLMSSACSFRTGGC